MTLDLHHDPRCGPQPPDLDLSPLDPQSLTVTLDLDYSPLTHIAIPDLDHEPLP